MAKPKLYPDLRAHSDAVRQLFAGDLERPLIIVGNGPSNAEPFVDRMPENPVIFRMNWFFLEDRLAYGNRVDGFFWAVDTPALQNELVGVVARKDYQLRAFFAPMRSEFHGTDERWPDERLRPQFDHWAIIAENPVLAREMMGRPLPTSGFQVMAFAMVLGFREIHLTGFDLYADDTKRYSWEVPERIAEKLARKDLKPGYEDAHARDRDISFFRTCREQFPDVGLHALSDSPFLREHLLPKESPTRGRALSRPKLPAFYPGTLQLADGARTRLRADAAPGEAPTEHYRMIDGKRCAYVTLVAGGGFEHGVRVLARSLRRVSDIPLVVLCTPRADKVLLARDELILYDVEPIENPNASMEMQERFRHTYSKLAVFGLTEWDRLVYLDADALVLQNIDELFAIDEFAAAPDLGMELRYDRFNSGVFVCQPSQELLRDMLGKVHLLGSYDGGDQGFLNEYFTSPRYLDKSYNVLKRLYVHHPNLFSWENMLVLHYVGRKPWQSLLSMDLPYEPLYELWFQMASTPHLVELARARKRRPKRWTRRFRKLRKLRRDPLQFVIDARVMRPLTNRLGLR